MITLLVEEGWRVDEDMVMRGYEAAVEIDFKDQEESSPYLGVEEGKRILSLLNNGP